MKRDILKGGFTSLNLDEALIGLAISCTTNPAAAIATEKLAELRGLTAEALEKVLERNAEAFLGVLNKHE